MLIALGTILFASIVFSGCSDDAVVTPETTPFPVTVEDDAVIKASIDGLGCNGYNEIENGHYNVLCSKRPATVIASKGYFSIGEDIYTIDMPLILNESLLEEGDPLVVTPLTTLVSTITDKDELEAFAKSLGLTLNQLKLKLHP